MRSRCPCLHQDSLLFRLPALEEGKDIVSRRITSLPSHLYLAMAMAIHVWADHGSKKNLSYLCPSLIVTSSSQLRCGLWECLTKSATSPEEHPEQVSTEKAASEELDETCLILQSKMWHGLSYHTVFGKIEGNGNKTQDMQKGTSQTFPRRAG